LRHDLQIALQQANSIVRFERALRELWEAGNAHQDRQVLSLAVCLREVVAELLPAAESARVKLFFASSSDCLVNFQASRLRQALVHLLEFAMESSASGAEVKITADEKDANARVAIALSAVTRAERGVSGVKARAGDKTPQSDGKRRELKRRLGLAVAWRIFESAGGILQSEDDGERLRIDVLLPLASRPK